jgi:exopolysaccharide biosynthesis polyprenyl glycosylphosphotransferase
MLKQHARLIEAGLRLFDLLTVGVALWVASAVALALGFADPGKAPLVAHFPLLATVLLCWIAASSLSRLYAIYRTQPVITEILRLANSLALVGVGAAVAAPLWHDQTIPIAVLRLYPVSAFLLLLTGRFLIRWSARVARRRGFNTRRFAVVGQGAMAGEVMERFALHPEWGYTFAGYVLEEGAVAEEGSQVLGRLSEFGTLLQEQVLDVVVFAVPSDRLGAVQEAARLCEEQGITVQIFLDMLHGGPARLASGDVDGLPMLAYTSVPTDELALAFKRLFDVVISAAALLVLAPVLAGVALAIRRESPGPVLFRQRRVGLNGREFDLFKFRSMHLDAEAQLAKLMALNEASGPVFKMRHDPRVTRIGRFIRKTSIDEFPQFWNVLRGEMSIVGPRPPIPSEVRQYKRWQRRRLSVRPGITCTWQISGRSDISFERWMELDLQYIDTWSLMGDLQIFAKTIPAVLTSRGAR